MRITKNSRLNYTISFYIPINNNLNKIKFYTKKKYIPGVYVDIRTNRIFIDSENYDYDDIFISNIDDLEIDSITESITHIESPDGEMLILNEDIVKTDKVRRVDLTLRIWVQDLELFFKAIDEGVKNPENPDEIIPLELISVITGLDSSYNVLFEEVVKKDLPQFERYNIFGAATGEVVKKRGYEDISLVVSTVAVDGYDVEEDAAYVFTIQVNDELDISAVNEDNIFLTMNGITLPLHEYKEIIFIKAQELTIYVWHDDEFGGKPFYISIPAITKPTIANIEEDFIRSKCSLTFINIDGIYYGEFDYEDDPYEVLSIAPTFSIRTNLEYVKPELSSATKIII